MDKGVLEQKRDYAKNVEEYIQVHDNPLDEDNLHNIALEYLNIFVDNYKINSLLDVGSGTGRVLRYFRKRNNFEIKGIEPVREMIDIAIKNGIDKKDIIEGYGEDLPLKSESFDAVCEFGVLHHAENPEKIVKEMMRVSRRAIFISDTNRFGANRMWVRLAKLLLYKLRLWNIALFIVRGGKRWKKTEGDGIVYSYSVYDSYNLLSEWADNIILIPLNQTKKSWFNPLLTSTNVLLCAFKNRKVKHG